MGWYLAPSLTVLRAEVDTRWPRRDRTSDGTIGDAAHQASRSDHNPNSRESVNALDLDKDGIDVAEVIRAAERHPSVHYWIYDRQIADRDNGFRRVRYTGSNPHDRHLHISIRQTRAAEQDRRPWGLLAGEDDDMALSDQDKQDVREAHALGAYDLWHVMANGRDYNGTSAKVAESVRANMQRVITPMMQAVVAPLEERLDRLAAAPPGSVVITDEQLERVLRRVIGSVDGATPAAD